MNHKIITQVCFSLKTGLTMEDLKTKLITLRTKLTEELGYFGIELKSVKFRYSSSKYQMDKKTNTIYKGLKSIKYLNEQVAEDLYALRDKEYKNFLEFLEWKR